MMSMPLSLAARRRTSCVRRPSESLGSEFSAMLYLPPDAAEHALAAAANEPEGSGKLYQLSVGVLPLELPQPAISAPVASTAATRAAGPRLRAAPPSALATIFTTVPDYPPQLAGTGMASAPSPNHERDVSRVWREEGPAIAGPSS
jgi:hypothetical protein